jgi:DNA-binding MarR family transcriptional regulator
MKRDNNEKILTDIKKLLILALIRQGVQSKEIAAALGVDPAIITRLIPSRKIKK